jgi:hypothetical protein
MNIDSNWMARPGVAAQWREAQAFSPSPRCARTDPEKYHYRKTSLLHKLTQTMLQCWGRTSGTPVLPWRASPIGVGSEFYTSQLRNGSRNVRQGFVLVGNLLTCTFRTWN